MTAVYASDEIITCQVPLSVQNSSHSVYVNVFHKYMKIKTFLEPILYFDYIRLLQLYPPRGTRLGGTPVMIQVTNFADNSTEYYPTCKFSMDFNQETEVFYSQALRHNLTHAVCISPDISDAFNDYLDAFKDAYVTINDLDGVYRKENTLLFTYIRDYGITEMVPAYTYMQQRQTITVKGLNFLNVYSLILKMVLEGTQQEIYFQQHVLFIDEETLVFDMPAMASMNFKYTRKSTFFISLN